MTMFDYVDKNMNSIRDMVKNGLIDSKIITYYHVVKSYNSCGSMPTMSKYKEVSASHKLKIRTVRYIVSEMKKPFRK